jgi:predicted acyl esterase
MISDGAVLIEKDVPIPMSDGHVLYGNIFRPRAGVTPCPPIVAFTPYGKDSDVAVDFKRYWDIVLRDHPEVVQGESDGRYLTWEVPDPQRWVPMGYAIVVVDARGTGKSPGFYDMMSPLQTRDVYDAIEWAAALPWSNGRVGLLGVSYLAVKQWQVAALQPPHLAAMIPWEGVFDHYRDFHRHGGIFSSAFLRLLWETQITVNQNGNAASPYLDRFTAERSTGAPLNPELLPGNLANIYCAGQQHFLDDAYFKMRTPLAARIRTPFLSAGNWGGLGLHLRGNVEGFAQSPSPHKWLEMHTDTHFASMYLPEAVALQKRFFDCFLKDEANGFRDEPALRLTIRDPRGFRQRRASEWPLPETCWDHYYLNADARLLSRTPLEAASSVEFEALTQDVTFRTAPFAQDAEFMGPVAAKLFVSTTTTDMDLFLTLRMFDPDDNEVTFVGANDPRAPVSQGWLRASHRKLDLPQTRPYQPVHTHDARSMLQPDEIYELDVEIWPTSVVVPRGYWLGLTVGGRDFERAGTPGIMKGSGLFLHNDPDDRPPSIFGGNNRVHTGAQYRSYLLLPYISADAR